MLLKKLLISYFLKFMIDLLGLKNIYRKSILIIFDYACLLSSLLFIIYIDENTKSTVLQLSYFTFLIALPTYFFSNQYKPLTRFLKSISIYSIISRNIFIVI